MVTRKLYKTGHCIVVALPSYMLAACSLEPGDTVRLTLHASSSAIAIQKHDPLRPTKKRPRRKRSS